MATEQKNKSFELLEEKMLPEVENQHPYEALQLAQSFIARKKKTIGRDETTALVFHGANILVKGGASADAGSLISWYIEDGAGDDYYFRIPEDIDNLIEMFNSLSSDKSHPILQKVYGPFHKLALRSETSLIIRKLNELENKWIEIFVAEKDWNIAVKALIRIGNDIKAANVLDCWAKDQGFLSEYPLYFARSILHLLSDGHLERANSLLQASTKYVNPLDEADATATDLSPAQSALAPSLAIWHLAVILTELAIIEPKARVDKNKIFILLIERYNGIINRVDPKLLPIVEKIGQVYFGINNSESIQNPMAAMLQNMMSAGGKGPNLKSNNSKIMKNGPSSAFNPEGLDINAAMKMLSQMK
jgi:hypothetical protein